MTTAKALEVEATEAARAFARRWSMQSAAKEDACDGLLFFDEALATLLTTFRETGVREAVERCAKVAETEAAGSSGGYTVACENIAALIRTTTPSVPKDTPTDTKNGEE